MELDPSKPITIRGTQDFWQATIGAIIFTAGFVLAYYFVDSLLNKEGISFLRNLPMTIFFLIVILLAGYNVARVTDYTLDFPKEKYKETHRLGPFKKSSWNSLHNVKHISLVTYRKTKVKMTVWFYGKKKRLILTFDGIETGLDFAKKTGTDPGW